MVLVMAVFVFMSISESCKHLIVTEERTSRTLLGILLRFTYIVFFLTTLAHQDTIVIRLGWAKGYGHDKIHQTVHL